jgi:hypothetical protein
MTKNSRIFRKLQHRHPKNRNTAEYGVNTNETLDFTLFNTTLGASNVRIRAEYTARMELVYENHMKIFTNRSVIEDRVGSAVKTPESTITERMRQQTTIFSAWQEAVVKAICFAKKKMKPTRIVTQNPKTRRIREQLNQTNGSIKLI